MNPEISGAIQFAKENYGWLERQKFMWKVRRQWKRADKLLARSIEEGTCYYGPFKGEFGHLLAHNLPLIVYLHKRGVKINYCGLRISEPFLVDEQGNSILASAHWLRDIFGEVWANTNSTELPADVEAEVEEWRKEAMASGQPYWEVDDDFFYWFVLREWMCNGHMDTYDLSKVYGPKGNSVAIFARSKDAPTTPGNGAPWDYVQLAESVAQYFEKVYLVGHPAMSKEFDFTSRNNIEVCITDDNRVVLQKCSASSLIISQHSGAVYLGEYTNNPVLIIYKGEGPIDTINDTKFFKENLGQRYPLSFAYSEDEVIEHIEQQHEKT